MAIMFYVFIFIFIMVTYTIFKNIELSSNIPNLIKARFYNVSVAYSDYNITLYRGDRSGENFLFAIKNNSASFSLQDIENLYQKAEKLHIHNKILITDYPITNTSITPKKLKEYEIDIWDSSKLISISTTTSSSTYNSSALKTSDTSDDTCYIEESSDDPIQDGASHAHSIFSIFNNKTEHL